MGKELPGSRPRVNRNRRRIIRVPYHNFGNSDSSEEDTQLVRMSNTNQPVDPLRMQLPDDRGNENRNNMENGNDQDDRNNNQEPADEEQRGNLSDLDRLRLEMTERITQLEEKLALRDRQVEILQVDRDKDRNLISTLRERAFASISNASSTFGPNLFSTPGINSQTRNLPGDFSRPPPAIPVSNQNSGNQNRETGILRPPLDNRGPNNSTPTGIPNGANRARNFENMRTDPYNLFRPRSGLVQMQNSDQSPLSSSQIVTRNEMESMFAQIRDLLNSTSSNSAKPDLSRPPSSGNFDSGNASFDYDDGLYRANRSENRSQSNHNFENDHSDEENLERRDSANQSRSSVHPRLIARAFDPTKITKYKGESDHRSPIAFIREFEEISESYASDDIFRARLFINAFDKEHFQGAKGFRFQIGYLKLRDFFLSKCWNDCSRERIIQQVACEKYDSAKFKNHGEWIISLYSKLFDCRLPALTIYSRLFNKLPSPYKFKLKPKHFASFCDLTGAIYDIQALDMPIPTVTQNARTPVTASASVMMIDDTCDQITGEVSTTGENECLSGNE